MSNDHCPNCHMLITFSYCSNCGWGAREIARNYKKNKDIDERTKDHQHSSAKPGGLGKD